ncbi:MAG TPA: UDP-N-acetylglucosamine 2-epimerase [Syntrophorhabdales bacterium]|nr:UDP-N-acetylglucosamine 2-epimerase [Syntrophorhabdales bacterium]
MTRRIVSVTGTRSDYGLMTPVMRSIVDSGDLTLELIVSGMHLLPEFKSSLEQVRKDNFCKLHIAGTTLGEDSGQAMAQSLGLSVFTFSSILANVGPDILLLQGDRGEMLAGAIAAAHMNIPIVHMSGGDYSGSIDNSIRNAISMFSHVHLTTCRKSTERLLAMGESVNRIFEVGEPGLDVIRNMTFVSPEAMPQELTLDLTKPIILATQHPVTTEADQAAWQITQTLEALKELDIQCVFTYPNSDAGGREMTRVLESYSQNRFIHIVPSLGSEKYLSLMRIASVMVGNSSSGIFESPSFKIPVVNIGTRQYGRLTSTNVINVGYPKEEIVSAVRYALENRSFRDQLKDCINPYGDGTTAGKTVDILRRLLITSALLAKWMRSEESLLSESPGAV